VSSIQGTDQLLFAEKKDRNLAIMLELSEEVACTVKTADKLFGAQARVAPAGVVFTLPNGDRLSAGRQDGVTEIADLAVCSKILHFAGDNFEFGLSLAAFCSD
jgi:hypothetical protein